MADNDILTNLGEQLGCDSNTAMLCGAIVMILVLLLIWKMLKTEKFGGNKNIYGGMDQYATQLSSGRKYF